MEKFIFLYTQNNQDKLMFINMPIGTQVDFENWSGLFEGFGAQLVRVCTWTELTRK